MTFRVLIIVITTLLSDFFSQHRGNRFGVEACRKNGAIPFALPNVVLMGTFERDDDLAGGCHFVFFPEAAATTVLVKGMNP